MSRAYCTRCSAERDVDGGRCPSGHRVAVDPPGYVGRHRARIVTPRLQVLEVLGFSDHGTTSTLPPDSGPRNRMKTRIPSTPRRSSRPVGRHRIGTPTTSTRPTEIATLSLATVDTEPTENTGVLVERLWEASNASMTDIERWHGPTQSVDAGPGRRHWPWIMAAITISVAALSLWMLPNAAQDRERATIDRINASVDDAASSLTAAAAVSTTIFDPDADTALLSGMAVELTRIDTAARRLVEEAVAAEEAGIREAADIGQAGEVALSLERRLSTVLTYRLLIESSLSLPELPLSATAQELSDVARQLSEAITSIRTNMESLPRDELLDAHRADTLAGIDQLADDQASYLGALRNGDIAAAENLSIGMERRLVAIHDSLDDLLVSLEPWATDTIEAIESNLGG